MNAEQKAASWFIVHRSSLIVFALTLFGAGLRFMYLNRPALWGDEAQTFRRVCGSWQELVDLIAVAGFAPLHYELYWWMAQHARLTPFMMRLPVAMAGTLMVPAMYFLAVQLVSRPTAILVAAFTACSAYMLGYARDAKMYADLWLFVALHMGCLLWWLRVRTRIAWWGWVCSGVIMLGVQITTLALLPIELLIVLTARPGNWRSLGQLLWMPISFLLVLIRYFRAESVHEMETIYQWMRRSLAGFRWPPLLAFVIGVGVFTAVPLFYYLKFNIYVQRVYDTQENRLNWRYTGINWVGPYNEGRIGPDLFRYAATAFLYNWEWPRPDQERFIRERTMKLLNGSAIAILAVLVLGALPWPYRRAGATPVAMFWLLLWIILPAYGFYCASERRAAWPMDWLRQIDRWTILVASTVVCLWIAAPPYDWRGKLRHAATTIAMIVTLFLLCVLLRWIIREPLPDSVWMPRYLGFIWPALAIVVAILLMRLPTRPLRGGAIALVLVINLAQHGARVFAGSEPPTELMARDMIETQPPGDTRMFYRFPAPGVAEPGAGTLMSFSGRYYMAVLSGKPITPPEVLRGFENSFAVGAIQALMPIELFVPGRLTREPDVKRIIVWDRVSPGQVDLNDRLLDKLSPQWKRVSEEEFYVRDHWTWRDMQTCRRRVYERRQTQ